MTESALRVRPELLGAALASPARRGFALLADLLFASIVGALGIAGILAAFAAVAAYRLVARGKRGFFRVGFAGVLAVMSFSVTLDHAEDVFFATSEESVPAYTARGSDLDAGGGPSQAHALAAPVGSAEDESKLAPEPGALAPGTPDDAKAKGRADSERLEKVLRLAFRAMEEEESNADERARAFAEVAGELAQAYEDSKPEERLAERIKLLESENERLRRDLESPSFLRTVRGLAEDVGLTFGWIGVYFTVLTALFNGSTPGKRLLGIRARRLDGRPFGLWLSFERFGGYAAGVATGLLGFIQILWDANRQGIHDRIAGTVVTLEERKTGLPVYTATVDQALSATADSTDEASGAAPSI